MFCCKFMIGVFTFVQMLNQLALRMKDLHALGYVHRDLKPGNVMWLPRENCWTVIDFGCAARTGDSARLAFSLAYASPEVVAAFRRGDKTIVAQVSPYHLQILNFTCMLLFEAAKEMVLVYW